MKLQQLSTPWMLVRMLLRLTRLPRDYRRSVSHHRALESSATHDGDMPENTKIIALKRGQFEGSTHRTGWGVALTELRKLHSSDGVEFDGFVESNFCWKWKKAGNVLLGRIPYRTTWMGISHFPPNIPEWAYPGGTWQALLCDDRWVESASRCVGLFALTEYHAAWMRTHAGVPCSVVAHPIRPSGMPFTMDAFRANDRKTVVQIGWWLRKLDTFFALRTRMRKIFVFPNSIGALLYAERFKRHVGGAFANDSVETIDFIPSGEFDRMLSESVVFLDVLDTSANNIVLDCIMRNTPILAGRHPAIEEYVGKDYPLFFSSIDEASSMLEDEERIAEAHAYLRAMDKTRFSPERFLRDVVESDIFRSAAELVRLRRSDGTGAAA